VTDAAPTTSRLRFAPEVSGVPVDIEHIDHIDDMRRYQVLIESAFPIEAAGMLKNLENKGDPWGTAARAALSRTSLRAGPQI
jgi:hypothetical protein